MWCDNFSGVFLGILWPKRIAGRDGCVLLSAQPSESQSPPWSQESSAPPEPSFVLVHSNLNILGETPARQPGQFLPWDEPGSSLGQTTLGPSFSCVRWGKDRLVLMDRSVSLSDSQTLCLFVCLSLSLSLSLLSVFMFSLLPLPQISLSIVLPLSISPDYFCNSIGSSHGCSGKMSDRGQRRWQK